MKLKPFLFLIISCMFTSLLKGQTITILQQDKTTSIRGLSVVNDSVAWISGSRGIIASTNDSGKTWNWQQVKGFEKADFRDIEAFNDKEAVIISSGTPALVLKTIDGGKSWQEKYRKTDSVYFLDAMDFSDRQHGYILGDPIDNKFLLLKTDDGGNTWNEVDNKPAALPSEAAFAASGTCLRLFNGSVNIVSGGQLSRLITWQPDKSKWNYINLAVAHGKSSQGAFSLSKGMNRFVIVGGDYSNDKKIDSTAVIYNSHTLKSYTTTSGPAGYQSSVEYIKGKIFLSTGTSGTNITTNGGLSWIKIDSTSFNVCRKAKDGKLVLLVGDKGKIAIFKL